MGRPRSENPKSVQVMVRLAPDDVEGLHRAVERANLQAEEMGLPLHTISSILRVWIQQRLAIDVDTSSTRQLRAAPHLSKASALLRGARKAGV